MAIWFDLDKVTDESFFDTAPLRFEYSMHLDATADEVWAGLVADKPLAWCKALNGRYTSERPFRVGTTREVAANFNTIKLKERFFIWDEAERRHAFYVEQANAPAFKQFAELYEVTPTEKGCIFVWKFAMAGRFGLGLPLKLISPAAKLALFDGFIRDTKKYFGTVK
ncbi:MULTISPECIES: SRPBCC family protein [unclassified Limnobacter]|jgi:hypothetical protein|uniref:SRPBCC family protein n=1 Tax=unclassified Limnobacter TaxID=2630203 RepID=UPI000C546D8D|nr:MULTISPECIES: SRPBCC family protein [unclassified Limnobacter]MAZ10487.1 MxaD family protein [Sutterellaceae bacterium]|tara:strand:+ start:3674 stop:4174 length:501 start_codon:yes stop_codon:yes gene_type:complete